MTLTLGHAALVLASWWYAVTGWIPAALRDEDE